ncbi:CobW family GTP-binding protein [Marinimicrobium sp. ARAG 43.8]|uniref:CobW family GTP-binding protein n=1 Tax=Marinimicrobium sp. ARAG 43.8 TaxID=3418719 RepID=UPI003CECAE58
MTLSSAPVPTNIITGFLGVGKTTAIRHLLQHRPPGENWAVLVNEFGEIGIDGALLRDGGARVREVPGGCICCAAGLPMTVALNQLLGRASERPDRLLIEPTGLGHPAQIIETLTGPFYEAVLDVRATITLVDPRKLSDKRYLDDAHFLDQMAVADVLVANKEELCDVSDWQQWEQWLAASNPAKTLAARVSQGALSIDWLDQPRLERPLHEPHLHRSDARLAPPVSGVLALAEGEPMRCRQNRGQGHYSVGWVFTPDWEFDYERLFAWINGLAVERIKAVMITEQGIFGFNGEGGVISVSELDEVPDSRLELIDKAAPESARLERELLALRVNGA